MSISGTSGRPQKCTRLRFTYNDDLAFLKEFLTYNPMQNGDGWETIQRNLELITGKKFSIKTLKCHLQLLIEIWLKRDEIDKIRSGVKEPYSEKDSLIQEISTLCSEYKVEAKRRKSISNDQKISELGKKAQNKYLENILDKDNTNNENDSDLMFIFQIEEHNYVKPENIPIHGTEEVIEVCNNEDMKSIINNVDLTQNNAPKKDEIPTQNTPVTSGNIISDLTKKNLKRKEPIRRNTLHYLSAKSRREGELKKKELELEERKVAIAERQLDLEEKKIIIEERRLELEFKERAHRLELEKEKARVELFEKKMSAQLLQSQQNIIDAIVLKKFL